MKKLDIDFGPGRSWAARPFMWIALVSALGWCGYEAWRYSSLVQAGRVLQAELEQAQARASAIALRTYETRRVPARDWTQALGVASRLNAPWVRLFDDVQSTAGDDVALLGMDPDVARAELRLQAEARDMNAVVDYLRRLNAVAGFDGVALESHQVNLQDPLQPVRFSVALRWRAAATGDVKADASSERSPP